MVSPGYIAGLGLVLGGLLTEFLGHVLTGVDYLQVIGPVIVGMGVGVGMVSGGVMNRVILVVVPSLVVIGLLLINVYDFWSLRSYGLFVGLPWGF